MFEYETKSVKWHDSVSLYRKKAKTSKSKFKFALVETGGPVYIGVCITWYNRQLKLYEEIPKRFKQRVCRVQKEIGNFITISHQFKPPFSLPAPWRIYRLPTVAQLPYGSDTVFLDCASFLRLKTTTKECNFGKVDRVEKASAKTTLKVISKEVSMPSSAIGWRCLRYLGISLEFIYRPIRSLLETS